jgi:hypothetical protein
MNSATSSLSLICPFTFTFFFLPADTPSILPATLEPRSRHGTSSASLEDESKLFVLIVFRLAQIAALLTWLLLLCLSVGPSTWSKRCLRSLARCLDPREPWSCRIWGNARRASPFPHAPRCARARSLMICSISCIDFGRTLTTAVTLERLLISLTTVRLSTPLSFAHPFDVCSLDIRADSDASAPSILLRCSRGGSDGQQLG